MRRRVLLIVTTVVLLAGVSMILWEIFDGPPLGLVLRYGLAPAGGPTARSVRIEEIEFLEFEAGYCRVGSHEGCGPGDFMGRLCAKVGLPWGTPPNHVGHDCPPRWVEVPHRFLIARKRITAGEYWRVRQPDRPVFQDLDGEKRCFRRRAEDFRGLLSVRSGREVRLPDRRELEFVRGHLGLPASLPRWERRSRMRYDREWYRDRFAGQWVKREYAFRLVIQGP